jgi:DNA polymerase III epsilon subunit family exonuclease
VCAVQLAFDSADRLVELLEERRGPLPPEEAARRLFRLAHLPEGMARGLLQDVVGGDSRLAWRGRLVGLAAPPGEHVLLEEARYVVVDLETTGLSAGHDRICEVGAVRIRDLEREAVFESLVDPGVPLPAAIGALTGLRPAQLRRAPPAERVVRRFLDFAGDAVLVAHNARFDLSFLDREVERLTGRRLAAPVVDTVWLARRLLAGRAERASLAALSRFFGTAVEPCHRALPDAEATAEILLQLIGLAQERGARTVAELCDLAAPQVRRVHAKRTLVAAAPTVPGVYLFRDAHDRVLYVGRARDLRARLRSYFRTAKQRPSVEAALGALERVEWRELGSELEAALEELRLIRELAPPANARGRGARAIYLRRRGDAIVAGTRPTEWGPIRSHRRAREAARALAGATDRELDDLLRGGPLPRLRERLAHLSDSLRYEEAARLRDRVAALEAVTAELRLLDRLRRAELCLLVPARQPGFTRAFVVAGGRVAEGRTLPPGARADAELATAVRRARAAEPSLAGDDADALLLIHSFLRRPPPELRVVPLAAVERAAA